MCGQLLEQTPRWLGNTAGTIVDCNIAAQRVELLSVKLWRSPLCRENQVTGDSDAE